MNTLVPIVALKGVCKAFPGVRALDDCRFELLPGEVHALMGENGAGKSTLMKVLAGVYQKDSGQILYDGREVEIDSPRAAQVLGISIIHQELNLMNHLSVAQNIFIGREPMKARGLFVDRARLEADAQRIFERLHFKLDPGIQVGELTVAKQQMVEIAKALSFDAKVLIMDEPTAALNSTEIEELFRIIRQLQEHGVGVIYISHKMDEIKRIADRVTVMRDGRYIDTVPARDTDMDTIIRMMVGRELFWGGAEESPAAGEVALEVRGMNRGREIRGVGFQVRKGEILGLAGLMGAGRTEVARAIFGADPFDSGEIYVRGEKVDIRTPADAVRHGIGYLSEDRKRFGLATGMDVQTNIVMASLSRFVSFKTFLKKPEIGRAAADLIKKLNVRTPSALQQVALLSGGNQQKIVVAKWLLRDCEVLFFDEPTRGIDVGAKTEIYKLMRSLAAQGKAIVMISSELPEVLHLCHRVLVMCEGRMTGGMPIQEATQEKIMQLATQREEAVGH